MSPNSWISLTNSCICLSWLDKVSNKFMIWNSDSNKYPCRNVLPCLNYEVTNKIIIMKWTSITKFCHYHWFITPSLNSSSKLTTFSVIFLLAFSSSKLTSFWQFFLPFIFFLFFSLTKTCEKIDYGRVVHMDRIEQSYNFRHH